MSDDVRFVASTGESSDTQSAFEWRGTLVEGAVRWHLTCLLISLGFDSDSKHAQPHIVVRREMKGRWKEWSDLYTLVLDEHFSSSAKSKRARASGSQTLQLEASDTEAWTSSLGLALVLIAYAETRQKKTDRELCANAFRVYISRCTTLPLDHFFAFAVEDRTLCWATLWTALPLRGST
eukprot:5145331-Amphidinium_carterae.1